MNKTRAKMMIFLIATVFSVPLLLALFWAVGQFLLYFQQGANPASIFHGHQLIIPQAEQARWLADEQPLPLPPTQAERDELLAAYYAAWEAFSRAYNTGDTSDLLTYWSGAAYAQIKNALATAQPLQQTHHGHQLRLRFFSSDTSVALLDDLQFTLIQVRNKQTLTLTVTATALLTLDNGFWRIRQITINYQSTE